MNAKWGDSLMTVSPAVLYRSLLLYVLFVEYLICHHKEYGTYNYRYYERIEYRNVSALSEKLIGSIFTDIYGIGIENTGNNVIDTEVGSTKQTGTESYAEYGRKRLELYACCKEQQYCTERLQKQELQEESTDRRRDPVINYYLPCYSLADDVSDKSAYHENKVMEAYNDEL